MRVPPRQGQPIFEENPNCVEGLTLTYTWSGADWCWNDAGIDDKVFCWDDVSIVLKVVGEDTMASQQRYNNLKEYEKDEFITLTCKVKGYKPTETKKKKVKAELTLDDIQLTVNEVLKALNVKILKD